MNEKLYKICEDIVDNEEEVKKFMQFDSMVEMYEYFHAKVPELSEEEFEDFIVDAFEMGELPKEASGQLSDDDLSAVAGGTGFGAKVAAVGITLASLLPAVGATNQQSMDTNTSASTSISQSINKEKVADSKKQERVGNLIERAIARIKNKLPREFVRGSNSLMRAVNQEKVNERYVRILLENGARVNEVGMNGSALHWAVRKPGHKEVVKLLLDYGADVNIKSKHNITALMYAARCKDKDVVNLLLEHGADINAKDYRNWTALTRAIEADNSDVVKILVEKGADVNIRNNKGQSALMMAVEKGDLDTVDLLLEHGAKVNTYDHNDKTALDIAEDQPQSKKMNIIINMLKEKGAKTYEELNLD